MLYYSFEEDFICKICFASDLVQDNLYIFVSSYTVTYLTFRLTAVYTWGQTYLQKLSTIYLSLFTECLLSHTFVLGTVLAPGMYSEKGPPFLKLFYHPEYWKDC